MKSLKKILLATGFLLAMAMVLPEVTHAQYVTRLAKDSISNAATRYITFNSTPDILKGLSVSAIVSTGTLSLTSVTLEHRLDTMTGAAADWTPVPTTSVAVSSTISTTKAVYTWDVITHGANGYRIKIVGGGTQKTYLYGALLRRQTN